MTGNAIKKTLEYHKISPKTIKHYGNNVIGLFFKPNNNLHALIKTYGGKYSASCKCWYIQKNKIQLQKLAFALSGKIGRAHV